MIEHVPQLVDWTALEERRWAEGVRHRFPQRLRVIENDEHAAIGPEATAGQTQP